MTHDNSHAAHGEQCSYINLGKSVHKCSSRLIASVDEILSLLDEGIEAIGLVDYVVTNQTTLRQGTDSR